jgi:hypothetical protein
MLRDREQVAVNQDGPPSCRTLAELVDVLPLSRQAKPLVSGAATAGEYLARLGEHQLDVDAIRVLAYALPIRKSVWWGVLCAWHGMSETSEPEQDLALQAAVRWCVEPTDERRRAAEAIARARVLENAVDCCVRAASLAGHSAGPDDPFLPRDAPGAARMVVAAAFLAFAQRAERDPKLTYRRIARMGLLVADNKIPWHLPQPLPK